MTGISNVGDWSFEVNSRTKLKAGRLDIFSYWKAGKILYHMEKQLQKEEKESEMRNK